MTEPSLFTRIRQHRVTPWLVGYAIAAWPAMELVGYVVGLFEWDPFLARAFTVLAFFGFFAAGVIAWYHGEGGRQDVPKTEVLLLAGLVLVAVTAILRIHAPGDQLDSSFDEIVAERPAVDGLAVAILPFEHFGASPDSLLTGGLHAEVIAELSKLPGLRIRSRETVSALERTGIREAARQLGVGHVATGLVRWAADSVRLTLTLSDSDDVPVWSQDFTASLRTADLLAIQTAIAERIAATLGVAFTATVAFQGPGATEDYQAYRYYLASQAFADVQDATTREAATRQMELAVASDPGFADAWARLAHLYLLDWWDGSLSDSSRRSARDALDRAVEVEPTSFHILVAQGGFAYRVERDYEKAMGLYLEASSLRPGDAVPLIHLAGVYRRADRWEDALTVIRRARLISPGHPLVASLQCEIEVLMHVDSASTTCESGRRTNPDDRWMAHYQVLAGLLLEANPERAQMQLDMMPESLRAAALDVADAGSASIDPAYYERGFATALMHETNTRNRRGAMLRLSGADAAARAIADTAIDVFGRRLERWTIEKRPYLAASTRARLAVAHAVRGDSAEALQHIETALEELPPTADGYIGRRVLAQHVQVAMLLGLHERALEAIATLLSGPSSHSGPLMRIDPLFEALWNHPRFLELTSGARPIV